MTTLLLAVLALSVGWSLGRYSRSRAVLVRLELAARPVDRRPAIDDRVAIELAAACCERWWTSAGTEHDCTRKDTTA